MQTRIPSFLVVARYTFWEIFHSRIVANVFFVGIGLVVLSLIAAEFTFGVPQRVALDFGLGACSLSLVGISIFMGVNLLANDIDSRTVYAVLARPVSRTSFLLGKTLGMSLILFINVLILALFSIATFVYLGGTVEPIIYWSFLFSYIEGLILLMCVLFFSLITTKVMAVVYTLCVYIAGHAIVEAKLIKYVQVRPFIRWMLDGYSFIFPNLNKLNIKDFVLYKTQLPDGYFTGGFLYGLLYISFLLVICSLIFNKKNLD